MGLPQVQEKLNQMLKGNKVDLIKHFKANPERKTIVINTNDGKKKVDLSTYASRLKTFIEGNNNPLMSIQEIQNTNVDWRDVNKFTDEKLVTRAGLLVRMYQSIMANKDDFEPQEIDEATRAYNYIMTRLDVMASPYYNHLDPEVFTKVPSDILSNIASNPENLEPDEGDLYSEVLLDEENNKALGDKALQTYLLNVAKNEKVREDLARQEARETLSSESNSSFSDIADLNKDIAILTRIRDERNGIKDDSQLNEDDQKKYDAFKNYSNEEVKDAMKVAQDSIIEKRRTIAAINRVLKTIDIDTVLPDFDEFNKYMSSERYNKLTEDMTDEQLEEVFSGNKSEEEILKSLDAIKPVKQVAPEESEAPAEKWYRSFVAQLQEMGLDKNPIGLGYICVRNDGLEPAEQYTKADNLSIEDGYKVLDNFNKAIEPAFLTRDANNEIDPKIEDGESYTDWISKSYWSLDQVPKEHMEYLYRMAKENKLFLKSTGMSVNTLGNNRYFHVNENGESELADNLEVLESIYNKSSNEDKVGPYSRDEFKKLFDLDAAACGYEIAVSVVHDNIYSAMRNDENADKVKLEKFNKDMTNALARKPLTIFALNNPNWSSNPEIMRDIEEALTIRDKIFGPQTEEETVFLNKRYVIQEHMEKFQEDLLKKIGCKSTEDLLNHVFLDQEHNEIEAGNSYELMTNLCAQVLSKREFHVDGDPIKFVPEAGIKQGVNKQAYIDELEFLVSRLVKFEGNLTKNTPEYENFAFALKHLPGNIYENLDGDELNFKNLGSYMDEVVKLGEDYIAAHPGKLSSRQVERVKIINRLKDLRKEVADENPHPGKNLDYRLAEKIFTAASVKSGNHMALKSDAIRSETISKIMNSDEFKRIKALPDDRKEEMLKTPGDKFIKSIYSHEKAAKEMKETERSINLSM